MSQKSANIARRLFAAAGRDERWVMGDENSLRNNSQTKAQSAATRERQRPRCPKARKEVHDEIRKRSRDGFMALSG